MLRRNFLKYLLISGIGTGKIFAQDSGYENVLGELFTEIIEKSKEVGTCSENDEMVRCVLGHEKDEMFYRSIVIDTNKNSVFDRYEDSGFLNSLQRSTSNGLTEIEYDEISLTPFLGIKNTDISVKFKTDYFNKLVRQLMRKDKISEREAFFKILHEFNIRSMYGTEKFEKEEFNINRGRGLPTDPENRIFKLYINFKEYLGIETNLQTLRNKQD